MLVCWYPASQGCWQLTSEMKAWAEWTPQTCGTMPPTVQWIQKRGSRVLHMPGSTQNPLISVPAELTWLPTPSSHSWCRWCVLLLCLLVATNTGWDECPLPFLGSASLRLLSTLSQPSARSLTADASSAGVNICQMSSLPPHYSRALCSLVPFVWAVLFQSLCVVWHFSPSPRSLPLFL